MAGGEPTPKQPEDNGTESPPDGSDPAASDEPRFLSRADLGESIAPHPSPKQTPFPVTDKPFLTRPPTMSSWALLDADGVPTGLPRLLQGAPDEPVAESPFKASAPPSAPTPLHTEAAIPDEESVFALGSEETDEVDPEALGDDEEDAAVEAPAPAPQQAPGPSQELQALRDQVERLEMRAWLFAVAGAVAGAAATAAWFAA